MPELLSWSRMTTSLGLISCCIASQQASIDALPMRTDLQSSVEVMTMLVAPCAAALRNCDRNSYLK
jgi:hypothetical protein